MLQGGLQGALSGAFIGGGAGAISASAQAYRYGRNPVTGRRLSTSSNNATIRFYPNNKGFLRNSEIKYLKKGEVIDRFGGSLGRYVSPRGTPVAMRSLPPGTLQKPYSQFRVIKPFPVKAGTIAPAFGQPGLGTQYITPVPVETLLKKGFIIRIK